VTTLTEFLLARIAEDEERARRAADVDGAAELLAALPTPLFEGLRAAFPARVLAECEAKRRIVAEHEMTTIRETTTAKGTYHWPAYCRRCTMDGEYADISREPREEPCVTLLALALPYADHPDYRDEWRP
jgi:hypothetical protein